MQPHGPPHDHHHHARPDPCGRLTIIIIVVVIAIISIATLAIASVSVARLDDLQEDVDHMASRRDERPNREDRPRDHMDDERDSEDNTVIINTGRGRGGVSHGGDDGKTYLIAYEHDFPPYSFRKKDGEICGLVSRIVKAACEAAGITCISVEIPNSKWCWASLNGDPFGILGPGLNGGYYTACANFSPTGPRMNSVMFSDNYAENLYAGFYVLPGSAGWNGRDMTGRVVGFLSNALASFVCVGEQSDIANRQLTDNQIRIYDNSIPLMITAMQNAQINTIFALHYSAKKYVDAGDLIAVRIDMTCSDGIGLMMLKTQDKFLEKFNEGLRAIKGSGELKRVCDKGNEDYGADYGTFDCLT